MVRLKGLLSVAGLGLCLWACDSTGGASLGPVDAGSLAGKWQMSSVREQSSMEMKITSPITRDTTMRSDTTMTYSDPSYYYEFKADNTCNVNQPASLANAKAAAVQTCTWSLSGSALTIQFDAQSTVLKAQVGITGSVLTAVTTVDTTLSYGTLTEIMHTVTTIKATKI